jgi:hypothetical protein
MESNVRLGARRSVGIAQKLVVLVDAINKRNCRCERRLFKRSASLAPWGLSPIDQTSRVRTVAQCSKVFLEAFGWPRRSARVLGWLLVGTSKALGCWRLSAVIKDRRGPQGLNFDGPALAAVLRRALAIGSYADGEPEGKLFAPRSPYGEGRCRVAIAFWFRGRLRSLLRIDQLLRR